LWKSDKLLALHILPNDCSVNRLGISVSRKVGKAVKRNLIKRLVRESYRLAEGGVAIGYDLVVVARSPAGLLKRETAFAEINRSLVGLLKKHSVFGDCK
jgi:ribonuclease P protein component